MTKLRTSSRYWHGLLLKSGLRPARVFDAIDFKLRLARVSDAIDFKLRPARVSDAIDFKLRPARVFDDLLLIIYVYRNNLAQSA